MGMIWQKVIFMVSCILVVNLPSVNSDDSGLLGSDAVSLGKQFPAVHRNVSPLSSRVQHSM